MPNCDHFPLVFVRGNLPIALLLSMVQSLTVPTRSDAAGPVDSTDATAPKTFIVRLVNITIPPECRIRDSKSISHPPTLFLKLYQDGAQLGSSSASEYGWESDYPDVERNRWTITDVGRKRYSIKVIDEGWVYDALTFEITALKASDLRGVVRVRGPESESDERLAYVEFEVVDAAPAADKAVEPANK